MTATIQGSENPINRGMMVFQTWFQSGVEKTDQNRDHEDQVIFIRYTTKLGGVAQHRKEGGQH